ncbi:MAG: hypothetical protein R3D32_01250 [Nitratireductor sp.]
MASFFEKGLWWFTAGLLGCDGGNATQNGEHGMTIGERINLLAYEPRKRAVVSYELTTQNMKGGAELGVASLSANDIWKLSTLKTRIVPYGERIRIASLKQFMETEDQAMAVVNNGRDLESMCIPFSNLQLLSGFNSEVSSRQFALDLKAALQNEYSAFVDDNPGFRCGFHSSLDLAEDVALLYTGYGVFEPLDDEQPVGTIAVVFEGEKPKLEVPLLPGDRPAGFYRGQTGLAFSVSREISPATVPGLPDNALFFLGKFPGEEYTGKTTRSQRLEMVHEPVRISGEPNPSGGELVTVVPGPVLASTEGWDGCWQVIVRQKTAFTVYYSLDSRPSRLLRIRPQSGPHFSIEGFVPGPFVDEFDRFWLELTEQFGNEAVLANSSLCTSMENLIADTGAQESFFWQDNSFGKRKPAPYIVVNGKRHDVLRHPGLGYFKLPMPGQMIGFKPPERGEQQQDLFSLDWLDHACKIEFINDDVITGLATALGRAGAVYLIRDEGSSLNLASSDALLLAISADGETCEPARSIPLETGTRLIMGGMIVQYHDN